MTKHGKIGKQAAKRARRGEPVVAPAVTPAAAPGDRPVAPIADHPAMQAVAAVVGLVEHPPLLALSTGLIGIGLATRTPRLARVGLRMLVTQGLATLAAGVIASDAGPVRPRAAGDAAPQPARAAASTPPVSPSGYAADGIAVVQALAREYPARAGPAGAAVAVIAAALMPKPAPGDGVAGAAIGWASDLIVDQIWQRVERHLPKARATR